MMASTAFSKITDLCHFRQPSILLGGALVLASFLLIKYHVIHRSRRLKFPIVGDRKDADFRLAMREGVAKFPDSPFIIPSDPPVVIAPKATLSDFKCFSNDEASFEEVVRQNFHTQLTGIGAADEDRTLLAVIKNDISRQLASTLNFVQEEAAYSFQSRLGPCKEWTAFKLYPTVAKIVALVSGRVFVGRPLSRNEEWVDANIKYTFQVIDVKNTMPRWPGFILKIISPFYNEMKSINKSRNKVTELLRPVIEAHLAKEGNEKLLSDEGDELGNVIACIISRTKPEYRRDLKYITDQLLNLSFAAIHTTTNTATQAIFDLASYREYIPILIDEIKEVIAEDGYDLTNDGILRMHKSSMPKLLKLDSFLKESQRVNPISLVSHTREATSDLTLSTGHFIPKGSRMAIPAWEIHNESPALYSEGLTKPLNEFDGLRYYHLRRLPGNENRHLFVSTSPQSLAFGHGNHSCPGRFFANNEIKVILIELLRNWDFRLPDDDKMEGGAWRRPKNLFEGFDYISDMAASILIRRKKV